ncbi:MAG: protein phosphatase 2C domain-containing protein [Planctomycetes bacterium]|nr:protein phosphatase 2C domain-containing protein [Planctomycetota bacterium]
MTCLLPELTVEEVRASASPEAGFGALSTSRGNLSLSAMEVRVHVTGLLASTAVTQTFENTHSEPLEATYIFPLPDRAAVTRFQFSVAGRVIEGQLKEREQARQEYDQAIQAGHRAAIAEEDRPDVFTMRVGNLMPGESATVRLDLSGPLPFADGEATFRFPLVVAPRYVPGAELPRPQVGTGTAPDTDAVPDASRISPAVLLQGYPNPVRLALSVEIHPQLPVTDLRCSLHAVLESTNKQGTQRIALHPGERLDRDFVLRWKIGGAGITTSVICHHGSGAPGEGTFALTLVPPAGLAQTQRPRDVAFVLDRSGSMGGWKIVAARRAMARMIETLTARDRFVAIAFDDRVDVPPGFDAKNLVSATDRNRHVADQFWASVDARGGTEMAVPLELAADALRETDPSRERVLVLVTDGQVANEDQILAHLAPKIRGARVFTLGIDQAVNAGFLNRLAGLGRGACELIESEARLDEVTDRVHRHLGTPVLTGLKVETAGFAMVPDAMVPSRLPDLFAGAPLTVYGRYSGNAGSVVVRGTGSDGEPWSAVLPVSLSIAPAVEHAWARGQLRTLEDRYAVRADAALAKQIVETSLRHGVLCRFTAFVAVDRAEIVNAGGEVHSVAQPVEAPAGWVQGALKAGRQMLQNFGGGGQMRKRLPTAKRKEVAPPSPVASPAPAAPACAAPPAPPTRATVPTPGSASGTPPKLTPEMIERLRTASTRGQKQSLSEANRRAESLPGQGSASRIGSREQAKDSSDNAKIQQLSVDHSLAQALVEAKTITPNEVQDHRFKNVLWKYLGSKEVGTGPEVTVVPVQTGDRFVLCTDGVTGVVPDANLRSFTKAVPDVQTCADDLALLALTNGSRDNVSCIIAAVVADGTLATGACSLLGNYRENNEDSIGVVRFGEWTVCLVADGMGGQAAGEVASKMAVELIGKALRKSLPSASDDNAVKAAIVQAIVQANEEIITAGSLDPNLQNMGSTVVLSVWRTGGKAMFVANVGDSRCYLVR